MMACVVRVLLGVALCVAPVLLSAQEPREQQEQYVPLDQLPPQEQLASAPLLVGAYAFVLVVLFVYLVSLSRKLAVVQREVERLEADLRRSGRT